MQNGCENSEEGFLRIGHAGQSIGEYGGLEPAESRAEAFSAVIPVRADAIGVDLALQVNLATAGVSRQWPKEGSGGGGCVSREQSARSRENIILVECSGW